MVQAVIYARVSTDDQNCERQIVELTAFAERCGYEVIEIFQEKASGAKNDREQRAKVMQLARQRKIDVVLIHELSRWGRNTIDLLQTVETLADHKVALKALNGQALDVSTSEGKLMLQVFSAVAEFERNLIKDRIKSGLANARRKGKKLGNQPFDRVEAVERALAEGLSVRKAAEKLGVSPTTVLKVKQGGFAK